MKYFLFFSIILLGLTTIPVYVNAELYDNIKIIDNNDSTIFARLYSIGSNSITLYNNDLSVKEVIQADSISRITTRQQFFPASMRNGLAIGIGAGFLGYISYQYLIADVPVWGSENNSQGTDWDSDDTRDLMLSIGGSAVLGIIIFGLIGSDIELNKGELFVE